MEFLADADRRIFLFLNSLNSPFFDEFMHFMSGKIIWIPLYLAILVAFAFKYRRKFLVLLLVIVLAATLSDQVTLHLFKNAFERLRPCNEPSLKALVHLYNGECGSGFSFVSAHAANSFNVAVLSLMLIGRRWYTIAILLWAAVIGYSRIYLGVHYPADVLCGAALGSLIGWSMSRLFFAIDEKLLKKKPWFSRQT
ncbi:MAG: phosphatase PAP2 family protein [Bacteroidales bacterium]|jgi:undecaprenyl-diphosphatase|nr:phosphatase PAP2 family protein [Bacteroidales bacterium]MCU0407484.1 phosphatase PAP2 family protein [Bacteroidales bacterium]